MDINPDMYFMREALKQAALALEKGEVPVIALSPTLEERLLQAVVRTDQGSVLAIDPTQAQRLASRIADVFASAVAQPVLLCTPALRPHLWRGCL